MLSQIAPAMKAEPAPSNILKNRMIPNHLPICSGETSSTLIAIVIVAHIKKKPCKTPAAIRNAGLGAQISIKLEAQKRGIIK